jgi:hypothetical protein
MNRSRTIVCLAASLALTLGATSSFGYTVNGVLTDWGVTPFSDWNPSASEISYILEDWPGPDPYPNGGERFDLEAGYAVVDDGKLFVGIVSSFPSIGALLSGELIKPGDLGIDLDGDGYYEFGVLMHGGLPSQVLANPTWTLPHGHVGIPANGPSTMVAGTPVGMASFVYNEVGVLEPDGTKTYIIEVSIPMGALGDWGADEMASLHYTMTCGNDALDWNVRVPEPSCLALFGLAGLGLWRRRR